MIDLQPNQDVTYIFKPRGACMDAVVKPAKVIRVGERLVLISINGIEKWVRPEEIRVG